MRQSAWHNIAYSILIIAFGILSSSCERSKGIGFDLVPQDEANLIYTDTLTIDLSTLLSEPANTANSALLNVGRYIDPVFGAVECRTAFTLTSADNDSITLTRTNPNSELRLDSAVWNLQFGSAYPSVSTLQQVNVHRLRTKLDVTPEREYNNTSPLAFDAMPLFQATASGRGLAEARDANNNLTFRLAFRTHTNGTPDNANFSTFAEQLFNLAKTGYTFDGFDTEFNGLVLAPASNDNAAILSFVDVNSATSLARSPIVLYYTDTYRRGSGLPDSVAQRNLTLFPRKRFNQYKSDRNGTLLQNINTPLVLSPSHLTNGFAYLQVGLGYQARLRFPTLQRLKNFGRIAIAKAELVLKAPPASTDVFPPPNNITLVQADANNKPQKITVSENLSINKYVYPESQLATQLFQRSPNVGFNARFEEYRVNITNYIQTLMKMEAADFANESLLILPLGSSVERLILNNQAGSPQKVYLRVFYTVFR